MIQFSPSSRNAILIVLVAGTASLCSGKQHDCFSKHRLRDVKGIPPVQLQRVHDVDDCQTTCMALGNDSCQSYVIHPTTGLCKLYNSPAGTKLQFSERTTYYELNPRQHANCTNERFKRSTKSKPIRKVFGMPGPPGDNSEENDIATNEVGTSDVWLEWSLWSACSKTCGVGTQKRTFICGDAPNIKCFKQATQTRTCRLNEDCTKVSSFVGPPLLRVRRNAAVVQNDHSSTNTANVAQKYGVTWDDWSPWTQCSVSCGTGGSKSRHRKCKGYGCQGVPNEKKTCGQPCSVWADWTPWTPCSKDCDGGSRTRNRQCSTYVGCVGEPIERDACNTQPCCTDWTNWLPCSSSCGPGLTKRTRRCGPDGYGAEVKEESKECNSGPCPEWSDWSPWSPCTVSCGGGIQSRTRVCSQYVLCPGNPNEQRPCNTHQCPDLGPWGEWTPCSMPCSGGTQSRSRPCATDSAYCPKAPSVPGGGNDPACYCDADLQGEQGCNAHKCAEWSEWKEWGACSATCGGGARERKRVCENDPVFCQGTNANDPSCICAGLDHSNEQCNAHQCPHWAPWSTWGECDQNCGGGMRERTRNCIVDDVFCANAPQQDGSCTCPGDAVISEICNDHSCANWKPWAEWSACSVTCGQGVSDRKRICNFDTTFCFGANLNNDACLCEDEGGKGDTDSKDCNDGLCPEWQEWAPWGACSTTCDKGKTKRTRTCSRTDAPCIVTDKGDTDETECNEGDCPTWGPWQPWSPCSTTCGDGIAKRARNCSRADAPCIGKVVDKGDTDEKACSDGDCPVWSTWEPWSACSTTCGYGMSSRNRLCSRADAPCVVTDKGDKDEKECNDGDCPIWGSWEPWAPCSQTCGYGMTFRNRLCSRADAPCIVTDKGDKDEKECKESDCPIWGSWEPWAPCSKTCGYGMSFRNRLCSRTDAPCDTDPTGKTNKDEQECNLGDCPIWGKWTPWEPCSVTCGPGTAGRTRKCSRDDAPCDNDGKGDTDQKDCDLGDCPVWKPWGEWTACSVSCAKGIQTRERQCSRADAPCVGDDKTNVDTKECDKGLCPQWTSWETWTECTTLCGGGSRTRARTCPIIDGCAGLNEESAVCNQIPCPDWGEWAPFSECSRSCGGGSTSRTRTCAIKGACKPGEPFEVGPTRCNTQPCPSWGSWSQWSQCSTTCDEGQREKKRTCENGPGCLGKSQDQEPCLMVPCVPDSFWSEWSPCSKTCEGGVQFRSRSECPEGPPHCGIETEDQVCEEQPCPQWTEWGQWTTCSRTCGGGQRDRQRTCPVVNGCIGKAVEIDDQPCNAFGCTTNDTPDGY